MHTVLEEIEKIGIVPVIKIDDVEKAVPLAKALIAGGIPCAEVTFRTSQGEEAIRRMCKECPDILAGAGTVLTIEQVDRAIDAGAKFIVSPGLNPKVVEYCLKKNIPVTPGCANPSDIEVALGFGLDVVKFFPAEQSGGLDYIKAVSAPYSSLKFIPTGGINANNIVKYLSFDKILACGGSWMVSSDLINEGKFDEITKLCKEAVQNVLGFSFAHMGINTANEETALKAAKMFEVMFNLESKVGAASAFAGKNIEIMKTLYLGTNGHIAIGTNSIIRAQTYLERCGFTFRKETTKFDAKGNLFTIYFTDEIAGFAVHLIQR
jgi:2-dehydro-3-deoxyphosphogluconate aldolase/(4S)-4-hydroxy-2-oxoglutarate aldolase